MQQQG
jgi:hypothetical protein